MSDIVECTECAKQCRQFETDAGHCPDCGAETAQLEDIYGPNGTHPDPDWKKP